MYKIDIYPDAQDQLAALSVTAQHRFSEVLAVLELVPWNGAPVNKQNPDGALRHVTFGTSGAGLITYLVLEHQREVHIVQELWIGD
jgi:hypothetical protein